MASGVPKDKYTYDQSVVPVKRMFHYLQCVDQALEHRDADITGILQLNIDENSPMPFKAKVFFTGSKYGIGELRGSAFFQKNDLGDKGVEFAPSNPAFPHVVVAGIPRKIKQLMFYSEEWLDYHYLEPIAFANKTIQGWEAEREAREAAAQAAAEAAEKAAQQSCFCAII